MKKTIARKGIALMLVLGMLLSMAAGCLAENKIWSVGDTGEEVRWIQERLQSLGYLDADPTGVYDEATETAVTWFQDEHNLLMTGMVDSVTWKVLSEETEKAHPKEEPDAPGAMEQVWNYLNPQATGMGLAEDKSYSYESYASYPEVEEVYEDGYWDGEYTFNTEEFTRFDSNRFLSTATSPLSTFAADVDTSSYAQFRRRVLQGEYVPADSIRVEEMLNYFRYDYDQPKGTDPFGVTLAYAPCPWNEKTRLLQIGLQARSVPEDERPAYNLVFLIDTSGSMEGEDRLDLVKRAFLLLLEELRPEDTVSIVAYASQDRVVLEGVPAGEKTRIMEAISELEAYGSTNGTAGLTRAYEVAERYLKPDGVNRILMATDGDLNVGPSGEGDLARLVSEKKAGGVSLTCLGVGLGNYKDNKMEALADYGDGNCWYIDTIYEARKALVSEAGGTFVTVAKDVKIQVDFNPAYVRGYRLIGYEDRLMAAEDFADDTKDGGEIGSGHRVTALYEIVPADSDFDFGTAESRYQTATAQEAGGEMLTVAIRAKEPEGTESKLYEYPVSPDLYEETLNDNLSFAAAVAEVAMLLRDSEWKGTATYSSALELLRSCGSVTGDVYKEEFLYLVNLLARAE